MKIMAVAIRLRSLLCSKVLLNVCVCVAESVIKQVNCSYFDQ